MITPSKEEDLNVEEKVEDLNAETFSKMRNLRLLKIGNVRLPQGLTFLSNDLRLMNWLGYPLKSMPRNFSPDKLVELIMPHSCIKQLWEGDWSLKWLRIIDLSDSRKLIMTLNFARVPNLEKLILKGCTKLSKIDSSLGDLKHLILLDLTNCKNLSSLPGAICSLTSLKTLTLSGCLKLDNMPMNLGNLEGLEELDVSGTAIREPPSFIFCLKNLKILSFQGCNGLPSKSWSWKKPLNFLLMTKTPDLMGLVLPSVSGLCSLTRLNMRNCNLQAIPSDIGYLSSLEELDLSENNFVCLPENISQLSNLQSFWVENCKSLQLLPELRASPYTTVMANGCTSLETLPLLKTKDDYRHIYFYLRNCFQFDNRGHCDLFTTILGKYFQECCYRESTKRERFDVVIPGSEVPNWFRPQSVGASIKLEVRKKIIGIALCTVYGLHDHHPPQVDQLSGPLGKILCYLKVNGNRGGAIPFAIVSEEFDIESDHLWFMYLLPNYLRRYFFLEKFHQIADGSSCQLEIELKCGDPRIEIKKCGVHMVYEEEMEDLKMKESMGQNECSSSIIPYNEGVDHFEEDIKIKRSRDDENGGSGEGSSTQIPHPKTKRVRPSDGE